MSPYWYLLFITCLFLFDPSYDTNGCCCNRWLPIEIWIVLDCIVEYVSNSLLMPLELFYPSSEWSSGSSLLREVKARCYWGFYRQLLTLLMSRCQLGYFQTFMVLPMLEGEVMIPMRLYHIRGSWSYYCWERRGGCSSRRGGKDASVGEERSMIH